MKRPLVFVVTVALVLSACATSGVTTRPQDIPGLEQRAAAAPNDANAATALGIAYFNAGRHEDAKNTLARAVANPAAPANAYLYLGLANEELKDWRAARTAYETYVNRGVAGEETERMRARLALVAREQLRAEAKQVLEREQQMSQEPPTARTVAVLPFQLVGISEELTPLQTALSDMIITDLSVSPAITSIERVKIGAMIDEMLLAQAGLSETNTGARVGMLLKAEHVVQGVLAQSGERQVRMDATVLNTARREAAGTFGQNEQLEQIFNLEKQIVFSIFDAVGVTLTQQERERINENRTGNLLAFLAYGRGLESMDRGNFQQASTFFRQASQLDPNFAPVQEAAQEAGDLQQASTEAPAEVAQQEQGAPAGGTETLAQSMNNEVNGSPATDLTAPQTDPAPPPTTNVIQNQAGNINNAQGQSNSVGNAAKATIRLVIPRPGT
jgi:tetratricopeptide (TPR) repeat protein